MDKPSIKKSIAYNTFFQILTVITPFITAPYVSRVLGAENIGIQSYTMSIQAYFSMFASLGTLTYGTRAISQNRDDAVKRSKLFWEIELMTIITSLVCLIAWLFVILFSQENKIFYIVLTMNILATMFDISWFFSGLEQFKLITIRNTVFKLLGVVCIFLFVKTSDDLVKYMAIFSASTMLSSLTLWTYLKRFIVKVPIKHLKIFPHFKETLVYFVPTIATSIYLVFDKTLLGMLTDDNAQNGYFQQAEKIINLSKSLVFSAVNTVMGARASYLFKKNAINEVKQKINTSINFILVLGFGCMFGIIGVARNFVPLFFGEGYTQVEYLLYIFSPIIVIIGVSNCLSSIYYVPSNRIKLGTKFLIIGSIVNLITNILLIPSFKAYGTAIASLVAELCITILYVMFCNGYMSFRLLFSFAYKKFLAGAVMAFVAFTLGKLQLNSLLTLLIQIAGGVTTYVFVLLILRDKWFMNFLNGYISKFIKKFNKERITG